MIGFLKDLSEARTERQLCFMNIKLILMELFHVTEFYILVLNLLVANNYS